MPVTTVNVSEVKLRLLRINDRNLVDQVAQGRIGQMLESYDVDSLAQDAGEEVWSGTMPVEGETNKAAITGVPMDTLLPQPKPGVYLLAAVDAKADEDSYQTPGTQWIVVTDLGLATFSGQQGLTVAARALSSAKAQAGVKLALLARNNSVLGEAPDRCRRPRHLPGRGDGRAGRQPAGRGLRLWLRRLHLPRADRPGLRPVRPRRQRPGRARAARRLPLSGARRLPPGRDGASDHAAAQRARRGDRRRAADGQDQPAGRGRGPGPAGDGPGRRLLQHRRAAGRQRLYRHLDRRGLCRPEGPGHRQHPVPGRGFRAGADPRRPEDRGQGPARRQAVGRRHRRPVPVRRPGGRARHRGQPDPAAGGDAVPGLLRLQVRPGAGRLLAAHPPDHHPGHRRRGPEPGRHPASTACPTPPCRSRPRSAPRCSIPAAAPPTRP